MIIYNADGQQLLITRVDDRSYRNRELMGGDSVVLYFALAEYAEVPVGAYCIVDGQTYTLYHPADIEIKHRRMFEYTVTMSSYQELAKERVFINPIDYRISFPLTARPHEHLQMFVDNMNRTDSGWTAGVCVDADEKLINYEQVSCLDALQAMAEAFDTEFEIVGKKVHLRKVQHNTVIPVELEYGRDKGLKSGVKRVSSDDDDSPIDILFVQGGEQNIDHSYGYRTLQLPLPRVEFFPYRIIPASILYDGTHFEGDSHFNANNAVEYSCLRNMIARTENVNRTGAEGSLDCSDIYPKRVGVVTDVQVTPAQNEDEADLYDIEDNTIPDDLDYWEYRIAGQSQTIIFQSGMLAGKEFAIAENDGYDHATRTFKLVSKEIDGEMMPNETFTPAVGDKYAVFGCSLPDAYIADNATKTGASWDMFKAGVRELHERSIQKFTFSGKIDEIWLRRHPSNLAKLTKVGSTVMFFDIDVVGSNVGFVTRIMSVKNYINNPYDVEIEISNTGRKKGRRQRLNAVLGIRPSPAGYADVARGLETDNETPSLQDYTIEDFTRALGYEDN